MRKFLAGLGLLIAMLIATPFVVFQAHNNTWIAAAAIVIAALSLILLVLPSHTHGAEPKSHEH